MEPIKNILANFPRGTSIPGLKITESEEPTLEQERERLRRSLRVASLDNTFDNFKPAPGTSEALKAFRALAEGETDWKMLLCYGGVGNGKSHLCEATVITLYKRGVFCQVATMARIMGALKSTMSPYSLISQYELLTRYCEPYPLIIDDVGMGGSGSEWEYGQLEEIIVTRYRERLFTILTTNRDLSDLPERVVSRFRDSEVGRIVFNEGADYRPKKGK